MIDYHLINLGEAVTSLKQLKLAYDRIIDDETEDRNIAELIHHLETLLRTYSERMRDPTLRFSRAEIETILLGFPRLNRLATSQSQYLVVLLRKDRKKVIETLRSLLFKQKKQKEYINWIEENFGTLLDVYIDPDCIVSTRYTEHKSQLDIFFGGKYGDPLGDGHGHYIFKLGQHLPIFSRHPAI